MSTLITDAFVQQYKGNVVVLSQQKGSKLRGTTRIEPITGKQHFFERLAATAAVKKTTRHSDTPLVDSPHSRRMVTLVDYEWADLVDQQDKIRLLINPESEYAINAAYALGRAFDDEVIAAISGTAKAGETGATDVVLPAAQKIASDFPAGGAAEGMTLNKLRQAKQILDTADVPDEDRFLAISPIGLQDLLEDNTVTSADYNTIKALVRGEIDTFLNFKFLRTTRLSKTGNDRKCLAWHKNAVGVALGKDIVSRITERADKSYSVQVYVCGTYGATRIEDEGVVEVSIDESV